MVHYLSKPLLFVCSNYIHLLAQLELELLDQMELELELELDQREQEVLE